MNTGSDALQPKAEGAEDKIESVERAQSQVFEDKGRVCSGSSDNLDASPNLDIYEHA